MCSSFTQRKIFRLTEGFWTFFFSLILKEKVTMKVSHFIMKLIYLNKKCLSVIVISMSVSIFCQCQHTCTRHIVYSSVSSCSFIWCGCKRTPRPQWSGRCRIPVPIKVGMSPGGFREGNYSTERETSSKLTHRPAADTGHEL